MSSEYFSFIINHLTFEEVTILGILRDEDATAAFKSMKRSQVAKEAAFTEAVFRKVIGKLAATHFISTVIAGKEHRVYLTDYGQAALDYSLREAIQ